MTKLNKEEQKELLRKCSKIKTPTMVDALKAQFNNPNIDIELSAEQRIVQLIEAEYYGRINKKIQKILKKSNIKFKSAELSTLNLSIDKHNSEIIIERLSTLEWLKDGFEILITGPCGVGKSYLASALGIHAIKNFFNVVSYSCNDLLNEINSALINDKKAYDKKMKELSTIDLLILEDFGLMDLDISKVRHLFSILENRYGIRSTIVTSQYPISNWYELIPNATFADAILDRLVHNSYRIELVGKSKRETLSF